MGRQEKAMIAKARIDVKTIENQLKLYKSDNFHYPSTDQGLESLVKKPSGSPEPKHWNNDGYMDRLPKDPWGNPYQYLNPGVHGKIDISSLGPDGVASDDDIGNWNIEQ
jgi:general secretion pathway protein G